MTVWLASSFVFEVLFNDAIICWDYAVSVIDERISMDHWWNETNRENPIYLEKTFSQGYVFHHKSDMKWPGIETRPATNSPIHGTANSVVHGNALDLYSWDSWIQSLPITGYSDRQVPWYRFLVSPMNAGIGRADFKWAATSSFGPF